MGGGLSEAAWDEFRVSSQFPDYWSLIEASLWEERQQENRSPARELSHGQRAARSRALVKSVTVRIKKQIQDPYTGVWRWIEQVDGPPAWFTKCELGRLTGQGPSIDETLRDLTKINKRNKRIREAVEDPRRAEQLISLIPEPD